VLGAVDINEQHLVVSERVDGEEKVIVVDAEAGDLVHELKPPNGKEVAAFGQSVALSNQFVVAHAYLKSGSAAAYVFKISDAPEIHGVIKRNDEIGALRKTMSAAGSKLAIQVSDSDPQRGREEVVLYDLPTGEQVARFREPVGTTRQFGYSVSLTSTILAVGAPGTAYNSSGTDADGGAVYLYDVDSSERLTTVADGKVGSGYGASVVIKSNHLLVGTPHDKMANGSFRGAGYLYRHTRSNKTQQ